MIDFGWRGEGQVDRYIDQRMEALQAEQCAAYDHAVLSQQKASWNLSVTVRLIVNHLNV